ncbi:hypothetical protein ABIA69_001691 [Lysinibacillus parviboronicapiens]|uniref:Transposase n=1 Tax=Lysinibacillus parviboronicapiens TaxID=436516 RepID=A0ABV2PHW1_9BACI
MGTRVSYPYEVKMKAIEMPISWCIVSPNYKKIGAKYFNQIINYYESTGNVSIIDLS